MESLSRIGSEYWNSYCVSLCLSVFAQKIKVQTQMLFLGEERSSVAPVNSACCIKSSKGWKNPLSCCFPGENLY